jgi:hypothetical protein
LDWAKQPQLKYGDTEAGIHGGDEDFYDSAAQTGTGIFINAFADQWTTDMDAHEPEHKWVCTEIIQHIIDICGFLSDSLVVKLHGSTAVVRIGTCSYDEAG